MRRVHSQEFRHTVPCLLWKVDRMLSLIEKFREKMRSLRNSPKESVEL